MSFFANIEKKLLSVPFVGKAVDWAKSLVLPGFKGLPIYDVLKFFLISARKVGFTERASAISFNFVMTIPPITLMLFALIPLLPISDQFIHEIFGLVRDVIPGEENNAGVIAFLNDILKNPRTRLLSTGFILALFFSSNAVMGIMRSFDKNYIGFKKRTKLQQRWIALKLTFILFILFLLTISTLIMQNKVLMWIGVDDPFWLRAISYARWIIIIALFLLSVSFIYRFAPAVHEKWAFFNTGALVCTMLMIVFALGFSYWVGNFSRYNELYGSISTILILFLLIFSNSLVLLIGFELNVSISSLIHNQKNSLLMVNDDDDDND